MFTILQVEDTPSDVYLTQAALRGHVQSEIHVAKDGQEAICFLSRSDGFADAPRPDLVLLDLNLPLKSGYEVLEHIKTDPELKTIPVVIFSTLTDNESRKRAYELCANSVIAKPTDLAKFRSAIQCITTYWSTFCIA